MINPRNRRATAWWGALVLWVAFPVLVFPMWPQFVVAALVGAAILYGIKAAVFYVTLGRTTLHEPAGSGFVDLDMFEQEVFEQADGSANDEFRSAIDELRTRYGARVPVQVIQTFVHNRLSSIQAEKKRILADADRQG